MAGGGGLPDKYDRPAAFVFVFNLVIGAGALALPVAFSNAGLLLAACFLALIAFVAWICTTYMVEAMNVGSILEVKRREMEAMKKAQLVEDEREKAEADACSREDLPNLSNKAGAHAATIQASPYRIVEDDSHLYGTFIDQEGLPEGMLDDARDPLIHSKINTNMSGHSSDEEDKDKEKAPLRRMEGGKHAIANEEEEEERQGNTPDSDQVSNAGDEDKEEHGIVHQLEMGALAELILGPVGKVVFYVVLIIYLYGDLSIYCVAVPSSLLAVTGPLTFVHLSSTATYYLYWLIFGLVLVPLVFFNFQKTKLLQAATMIMRFLAFSLMIILPIIYIIHRQEVYVPTVKELVNPAALFSLYGTAIYSFMCHHSLPSILFPVRRKRHLSSLLALDFLAVYSIYVVLAVVAILAFGRDPHSICQDNLPCSIQPLYTENFDTYSVRPIGWYIALFPVFTLSTNFPLIAMTLRNNLMTLIPVGLHWPIFLRRVVFALLATVPPLIIAAITTNVDELVSFTGSFGGLGIMFFFPTILIVVGRYRFTLPPKQSPLRSALGHPLIAALVLLFACICLVLTILSQSYRLWLAMPEILNEGHYYLNRMGWSIRI